MLTGQKSWPVGVCCRPAGLSLLIIRPRLRSRTCVICSASGIWLKLPISTVNEGAKMGMLKACVQFLRAMLIPKAHLVVENLALRQQLAVCKQSVKHPKLRLRDRVFWVLLSRLWSNWRSALAIVQPETFVRWHRQGFNLFWRWKSRGHFRMHGPDPGFHGELWQEKLAGRGHPCTSRLHERPSAPTASAWWVVWRGDLCVGLWGDP